MKGKTVVNVLMVVVGLALTGAAFFLRGDDLRLLGGASLGVGIVLFANGVAALLRARFERLHPEEARRSAIEVDDERNTLIRDRAKARAGDITQWGIAGLGVLMILIDADLWVTAVVMGVFMLYSILTAVFVARYQREM